MKAPPLKKLRAVLLYSAGHLGSAIALNILHKSDDITIVGIVRAEPAPLTWKGLKKGYRQLRSIGLQFAWLLLWQRFVQFVVFYVIAPLCKREHLMAAWQLADRHGIPSLKTANINSQRALHFLRALEPDVILSVYFSQILKEPVLSLPPLGAYNVHPGWLPDYKGAMNYFWVIRNGEDRAGVSVHRMDAGIDTGPLLARRNFIISPGATQQEVLIRTAIIGARLLRRILHAMARGVMPTALQVEAQEGRYYSVPGHADFREYFSRRRFFRIRNTMGMVLRRKHG